MDRDRLNEARFGLKVTESRDASEKDEIGSDMDYVSSSVASSFDYKLT